MRTKSTMKTCFYYRLCTRKCIFIVDFVRILVLQQKHIFVVVDFVRNSHTTLKMHFLCYIQSSYKILNKIMISLIKSKTKICFLEYSIHEIVILSSIVWLKKIQQDHDSMFSTQYNHNFIIQKINR